MEEDGIGWGIGFRVLESPSRQETSLSVPEISCQGDRDEDEAVLVLVDFRFGG